MEDSNMKRFYTILIATAFAAFFTACEGLNTIPEFDESEAFASFPTALFSINEDGGQVVIPVEIASIKPVQTVVAYKIIEGTAKAGVDFKDTNSAATLNFDGTARRQNIVIDILPHIGDYTQDKSFSIELIKPADLKVSLENTCSITILDLDHPLAEILCDYAGTATSSYDGDVAWTMTIQKDPKDVTVIWMKGITNEFMAENQKFYANVNFDEGGKIIGITFPAGQYAPYPGYSSYDFYLVGNTAGTGSYFPDSALTWAYANGKFTYDGESPDSIGIIAVVKGGSVTTSGDIAGWWNRYDVPPSFTKL